MIRFKITKSDKLSINSYTASSAHQGGPSRADEKQSDLHRPNRLTHHYDILNVFLK